MAEKPGRVQRRRQATRERIFRAAIDLFREKGFDQVTVAEITEAADIGKGTFFTYFPTKEAVLGYLGESVVEPIAADLAEALQRGSRAPDAIDSAFQSACAWHERHRSLTEQVVLASLRHPAAFSADAGNQARLLSVLAGAVGSGQARGDFDPGVRPEDAAIVLSSTYFGTVLAWLRDPAGRELSDQMRASVAIVLRGLRP